MTRKFQVASASLAGLLIASTQLCAGAQTPATTTGGAPVPSLSPPSTNATSVLPGPTGGTPGLGSSLANQPLQATVGAVELDISGTPLAIGPYIGVKIRVQNNTNNPLLLDGDRAVVERGSTQMPAVSNATVEATADPPEPKSEIAKNGILGAVTVGAYLAIKDQMVQNGPVLGRFGGDERRREASAARFGKRIIWTGDSTEGVLYFPTSNISDINGGNIRLPIVTFPSLDVRGYVSTAANNLPNPVPKKVELLKVERVTPGNDKAPRTTNSTVVAPLPRLSPP